MTDLIWLKLWLMAVLISMISVTFIVKDMLKRLLGPGPIEKGPGVIVVSEDDDDETVSEESESDYPSDLM